MKKNDLRKNDYSSLQFELKQFITCLQIKVDG